MSDDDPPTSAFDAFALDERLRRAVEGLGFEEPTPVQSEAMPPLLQGRDVIGGARTGSGKTAAFGLPLLQRVIEGGPARALVLAPTRELAIQVANALRSFAKHIDGVKIVTIYGGAPYGPQLKALRAGATVIVGTPGRVIDHMERGTLDLSSLEYFVLDEADEMLRMGFIDEVERIFAATPETRQCALFSATMPEPIRKVAQKYLQDPIRVEVEGRGVSVDHIEQRWLYVPHRFKVEALLRVLRGVARGTTLVFARTRAGCGEIADKLIKQGFDIDALHGDLTQGARERVLQRMRSRRLRVVVATDVAARGLDVEHIEHVINFDMPDDANVYVHRIGRTGRAGREGMAITFVTPRERHRLRDIERRLKTKIEQGTVPSDSEIAQIEQGSLETSITDAAAGNTSPALTWVTRLEASTDLDAHKLAAAAITLLARHEGVSLDLPESTAPPTWSTPPDKRQRPERKPFDKRRAPSDEPEVQLFFPLGKTKGVRPGDLVGLLANEAGIPGGSIGRVTVLSHKSFVALPKSVAEHVLRVLPRVSLRGRDVPIALAHPQDQRAPTERPSHALRKAHKGPRGKHKPWPGGFKRKHKKKDD